VKHWEIIADNLKKADWCCGCISNTDHKGRQFWIVAAEREDAGRFIVHADRVPIAFIELQAAIHCQREVGISRPVRIFSPNPTIL
jgi:hypothetical protein